MKSNHRGVFVLLISAIVLSGCATIFKGYQGTLEINNAPQNLTVSTLEGVNLIVIDKSIRASKPDPQNDREKIYYDSTIAGTKIVELPSKRSYVLIMRDQLIETKIEVHPKIGLGWFFLDIVFGIVPIIPDAITGNWNFYRPIEYPNK